MVAIRTSIAFAVMLTALLVSKNAAAQTTPVTTLINPGFETGTAGQPVSVGWTQIAGLGPMYVTTGANLSPGDPTAAQAGANFITANRLANPSDTTNSSRGVFQNVDLTPYSSLINLGSRQMEVALFYNANDANDAAVVSYNFLNGLGNTIGNTYSFTGNAGGWTPLSLLGEIPVGAATMRLELRGNIVSAGTARNVSYDSVSANILPPAPPPPPDSLGDFVNGNLIQFNNDGNWSWYMDERAIVDTTNGKLLISSQSSSNTTGVTGGTVHTASFDFNTGARFRAAMRTGQEDDHNSGGLIILPNGKYLTMYSNHGNTGGLGDEFSHWRVSTNPHDPTSWAAQKTFNWNSATDNPGRDPAGGDQNNVSYHNIFHLAGDAQNPNDDRIFNFSRATGQAPNILEYNSTADTWTWRGQLLTNTVGGYSTGYLKYASNGVDKVYFITTETHPRNYNNSIYAGYFGIDGKAYRMDGTLVDSNSFDNGFTGGSVPDGATFSVVQQANPLGFGFNRLWTVDSALDGANNLLAMYVSRWDNDGTGNPGGDANPIDHRIHYARWNGTSWQTTQLAQMGDRLFGDEQDYTGNGALVPGDPNTIYISTQYDPREFDPLNPKTVPDTPFREIYKGVTADGGATWSWSAITENSSVHNLRPIVPDSFGGDRAVVWFRGTYTNAQNIDAAVVGIVEREDEHLGLVTYVDATTANTTRSTGAAIGATGPTGAAGATDNLWHQRTGFGNGGSVFSANEGGSENAPTLKTTLSGLNDGLYDIFAYFWSDNDEDWRLTAGLDSANLIPFRHHGAQHAFEDQFLDIDVVSANTNDLQLYRAYVGRVDVNGGSPIDVFIDDWSTTNTANRTWYDGIGYALVSMAGDFNGDGVVDLADYVVWRDGFPTIYDQDDYDDWRANFGAVSASSAGSTTHTQVPEPATVWAVLLAATMLFSCIRMRT